VADIPLWLQYAEAIGQVLGGVGLFGAVAAYWLQSHARRRQRARERDGLLILLEDEIARNRQQLRAMREHKYWITKAPKPNLRFATWLETRAKLSDLLENEDQFNDFAKYYGNLLVLDETRLDDQRSEPERQEMVWRWLDQVLTLTKICDGHIRQYVPDAGEGAASKTLGKALTRPGDGEQQELGSQAPTPRRPINPEKQE
jgi:hypothetical protein